MMNFWPQQILARIFHKTWDIKPSYKKYGPVILLCYTMIVQFPWVAQGQDSTANDTIAPVRPLARPWGSKGASRDLPAHGKVRPLARPWADKLLSDLPSYSPRCAQFHKSIAKADACAHPSWVPTLECPNQGQVKRAAILLEMMDKVIQSHDYRHSGKTIAHEGGRRGYGYEARTLVCKMFNESTFRPQILASTSSAGGLVGVTRSTARALMSGFHGRRLRFRSKIPHFAHIKSGDQLYEAMKKSIPLQLEVALAVMQLKNLEGEALHRKNPSRNPAMVGIGSLLRLYYGHPNSKVNDAYASQIINCSRCVRDNGNVFTQLCLSYAKGKKKEC